MLRVETAKGDIEFRCNCTLSSTICGGWLRLRSPSPRPGTLAGFSINPILPIIAEGGKTLVTCRHGHNLGACKPRCCCAEALHCGGGRCRPRSSGCAEMMIRERSMASENTWPALPAEDRQRHRWLLRRQSRRVRSPNHAFCNGRAVVSRPTPSGALVRPKSLMVHHRLRLLAAFCERRLGAKLSGSRRPFMAGAPQAAAAATI
jgi:hypothetical protein